MSLSARAMRQRFVLSIRRAPIAYALACTACGGTVEAPPDTRGSADLSLSAPASSYSQTFSSDAGDVSPLHLAVDRRDQAFVLACIRPCDDGDRLFARVDANGSVVFSKELGANHGVKRFDLIALSKDGGWG